MGVLRWLFSSGDFMAHQYCYLRNPVMIRLHYWSDLLIGLAYVAISVTLVYLVRRGRRDIPFHWMFLAFGAFIIACGGTHFMEIVTLTNPLYWLAGSVKAATAMASVATALALPPLVPRALHLVRAARLSDDRKAELEIANTALQKEIQERRRAEAEVRELAVKLDARVVQRTAELARANEDLAELAAIVQHSRDAIFSWSLDGVIKSWNPAAERVFGYPSEEMIGRNIVRLVPDDRRAELEELIDRVRAGGQTEPFETVRIRNDGTRIDVLLSVSPVKDGGGQIRSASVIARDITEQKRSEEQLRRVQKLESLGLIAGGVAHDFNNLLVGILGNASLAMESLPPSNPNHVLLDNVVKASERAAHLTQQLLAYAGKGRFISEKVDLSQLVREISSLIQTSIPKTVHLRMDLEDNLPVVEADPGQLQQVIMNLVINGAEAIGESPGVVLVTTASQGVDEAYIQQNFADETLVQGRYVALEVHDSGCGMSEALRAQIFDPFFTTKFTGRGLGLSAVIGIIRSHKGAIRVYSEPGKGSTFKILLPAVEGLPQPAQLESLREALSGTGLILVVDDEELIRKTAQSALERYGYSVLTANDGQEAVELFRERADEVKVVLLDMTMPVMGGEEAFRQIRVLRPNARVIVSSGYNEVEAIRRFTAKGIAAFIQKPYTAAKLARIVKGAMEMKQGIKT
jgi:two-component system cell cycle sensor histidine kinase/response regulator CckA